MKDMTLYSNKNNNEIDRYFKKHRFQFILFIEDNLGIKLNTLEKTSLFFNQNPKQIRKFSKYYN